MKFEFFCNSKGGLLTNIIVLLVVFLIGTFFGVSILSNSFGGYFKKGIGSLELSPDVDVSELIEVCSDFRDEICSGLGQKGVEITGNAVQENQNLTESEQEGESLG